MEGKSQSTHSRLTEVLGQDIWRVNFYRFCQLLEQENSHAPLLGSTEHLFLDPVRFRPWPGMSFPVSELRSVETDEENVNLPPTIRTTFLGLYGVDSPLPTAYLDDIAQRREGYEATTAFLDIFNHRITTQYYRIWRKYAYPATFEKEGTDKTSQCLFGLIGLGIPGTAQNIATPMSRFLALLGTMRLPTRNAEGIEALVKLLAPNTHVMVTNYDPVKIAVSEPSCLDKKKRLSLSQRATLGKTATEACSRVLLMLSTSDSKEAKAWLPGEQLHTDLMVLMRVYLAYRSDVRIQLTIPIHVLPEQKLMKKNRIQLGRTGLLGLKNGKLKKNITNMTINLGNYEGLVCSTPEIAQSGEYRFA